MLAVNRMQSSMPVRPAYIVCALMVCAALAVSALTQPSLTAENGLGWDGSQYARMTGQCWRETISALEPFVYRFGTPCIAALVPVASAKTALHITNIGASLLLLVLLTLLLRRHVPDTIVPWLIIAFAWHWEAPLRYTWWYPTYVDPLSICAITAALLVADRPVLFTIVCAAGVIVRETGLVVPFAYVTGRLLAATDFGRTFDWRRVAADRSVRTAVIAGLASLAAFGVTHVAVTPATDYWIADSAIVWLYSKPVPVYVLSWFIAFGPMLVLGFVKWPAVRRLFAAYPEFGMLLFGITVLALIGGTDTERFMMWGAPVVLLAVGVAAAEIDWSKARGPLALLVVTHIINGRWFLTTPIRTVEGPRAWPILTPFHANRLEDLISITNDHMASFVGFAEYTVLALVLWVWLRQSGTGRPAAEA